MSDHDEMDLKLAADAVRALPGWMDRALKAEAKVAEYAHKERVMAIVKKAQQKQAILPKHVDLMKCSADTLVKLEASIDMMPDIAVARGEIQLFGAPEGPMDSRAPSVPHSDAQKAAEALRDFTLTGLSEE